MFILHHIFFRVELQLKQTSLRCHWQTGVTRCFTPTILYTDVDGQCDKLVTDDRHKFITLIVQLSWQHVRWWTWQLIWLVPTKIRMVHVT